jgi:hypothetical protein
MCHLNLAGPWDAQSRISRPMHVLQLLPRAPNTARYCSYGSGIADHVWSIEELVGLLGYICRAPQSQVRYMNRVRNHKRDGYVIIFDDHHFINCEFRNFRYSGGDCQLENVTRDAGSYIEHLGPAKATVIMLETVGMLRGSEMTVPHIGCRKKIASN